MTVIALLEKPNEWGADSLLGWIDSAEGSLVCDNPGKLFGIGLLSAFFSIMFPMRAYAVIATPSNADLVALLVAAMFGGFACHFLYLSAKAFLVQRALATIRDSIKPTSAECRANTTYVDSPRRQGN